MERIDDLKTTRAPEGAGADETIAEEGKHRRMVLGIVVLLILFLIPAVAILLTSTRHLPVQGPQLIAGGNVQAGKDAIASYGCGSCHTIAGVPGAIGRVGPVLDSRLTQQSFIAGRLPNNLQNLATWIQQPQEVDPGVDMPDLGISGQTARDIAAYLESLR
jgi:cytochrome c